MPEKKPNVLFILADDLGWSDTSLYGSKLYETPNIDALAERGMMFTNAYAANPLCSPTRGSIMTGLWPARTGITTPGCHLDRIVLESFLSERGPPHNKALVAQSVTRLSTEYKTLASTFHDAGYKTAHIGKWHLGAEPYSPFEHGFDIDIPHTPAPSPLADGWFAPWKVYPGEGEPGEHLEDRMAEEAVEFIRENKKGPFLLNFWQFSVHSPWHAKQDVVEKYSKKVDPENPQRNAVYAAMVEILDDAIGRLIGTLEEEGILDDTIVIFFSDNGGVHWSAKEHVHPDYVDVPITSNTPLRGGKANIYEGGSREPLIVVWPEHIKPGSRNDQAIVQSIDFFSTLTELCGLNAPESVDGISFVPALKGESLERDAIFCHFPHYTPAADGLPSTYVCKGEWKLIRFYCDNEDQTDRLELYNLAEDIGESNNLADEQSDRVTELNGLIDQFLTDAGAVIPVPNPAYHSGNNT
jgi:arylsulfatase A-like enzyme